LACRAKRALVVVAMLIGAVAQGSASAETITLCPLSDFTPSFRAVRFDVPNGASFFSIESHTTRPARISDDGNWHLAGGVVVVNADTLALEASRVETFATDPRGVVVRTAVADGGRTAVFTPDTPFYHSASRPRAGLAAGSYYAIAFGTDGGSQGPNEFWSYDVRVSGVHACTSVGSGTVFDIDHTEFSGGTQVYAPGVGTAESITYAFDTDADLVVGLMDADAQADGEATLDYAMPLGSGTVHKTITPFVSTAGTHSFSAGFTGLAPEVLIAGVALDLDPTTGRDSAPGAEDDK
jgi:hypothetical protein